MQVSTDFAAALREIRQHIDVLTRENIALKRELAEVRKIATNAQDASVTQRRALTMQAIAQQDPAHMRQLAITSTNPIESELLRLFMPTEAIAQEPLNVSPELVNTMLANLRSAPPLPPPPPAPVVPTTKAKGLALYEQMQQDAAYQKSQRAEQSKLQAMQEQIRAKQAMKENGTRFGLSEDEWF